MKPKLLALSLAAVLAASSPAAAWHGGYYHRGYDPGAAVALGMFGLALGAAVAASQAPVYPPVPYYAPSPYPYDPGCAPGFV